MSVPGARSRLSDLRSVFVLFALVATLRCATTSTAAASSANAEADSSDDSDAGKPVRIIAADEKTSPVGFRKLLLKLPRDLVVGKVRTGKSCEESGPLTWKTSKDGAIAEQFGDLLLDELTSAGYTIVGDRESLFEDPHGPRAEYLIAGIVRDVRASVCYAAPRKKNAGGVAAATLNVDWQIYSHRSKSVALKATTRGETFVPGSTDDPGEEAIERAFVSAARQLMADPRFKDLVTGKGPDRVAHREETPVIVAYATAPARPSVSAEAAVSDSRMSVVTVFSGDSMGSGFVISQDGYLLTNQHVVGQNKFVRARFLTGREVNGEVVRSDPVRDVALVKLEADIYKFLPLGESARVRPGSDVFAIGTPLAENLGQTVTKGVLSGYGEEDGLRILRSDVAIHQGSSGGPLLDRSGMVVALAVSGYMLMPDGVGVGLNSFIPIEDALSTLAIRKASR
jgi:S1-C subfamily serine protease